MIAWSRVVIVTWAALVSAGPASAQTVSDVECLLASNLYSRAGKDDQVRKLAEANKYYYLGRVSARLSAQQIRAQMLAGSKALNPAHASKVMDACNKRMRNAAAEVEAAGKQVAPHKK